MSGICNVEIGGTVSFWRHTRETRVTLSLQSAPLSKLCGSAINTKDGHFLVHLGTLRSHLVDSIPLSQRGMRILHILQGPLDSLGDMAWWTPLEQVIHARNYVHYSRINCGFSLKTRFMCRKDMAHKAIFTLRGMIMGSHVGKLTVFKPLT